MRVQGDRLGVCECLFVCLCVFVYFCECVVRSCLGRRRPPDIGDAVPEAGSRTLGVGFGRPQPPIEPPTALCLPIEGRSIRPGLPGMCVLAYVFFFMSVCVFVSFCVW